MNFGVKAIHSVSNAKNNDGTHAVEKEDEILCSFSRKYMHHTAQQISIFIAFSYLLRKAFCVEPLHCAEKEQRPNWGDMLLVNWGKFYDLEALKGKIHA